MVFILHRLSLLGWSWKSISDDVQHYMYDLGRYSVRAASALLEPRRKMILLTITALIMLDIIDPTSAFLPPPHSTILPFDILSTPPPQHPCSSAVAVSTFSPGLARPIACMQAILQHTAKAHMDPSS